MPPPKFIFQEAMAPTREARKLVTIAIVGAGFMGETHAASYRKIDDAEVKFVCDIDPSKGRPLAGSSGAEYVADFSDLLTREVDAIDVCLPTPLHRPFAVGALEAGFNLFLEKPLAISVEEGEAIRDAARKASGASMVGHVLRFWPGYSELRSTVVGGEIGDPRHMLAYRLGPPPAWAEWYMDMRKSNGVIFDLGIHDLDFVRWTMGEPRSVFAQTFDRGEVQTHGQVILDYGGGEALVECTWMGSRSFPFTTYVEVAGTGGLVHIDGRKNNPFVIFLEEGSTGHSSTCISTSDPYHEDGYVRELRHFVDCVRDGRDPAVPVSEALETIRLSVAAVESAKSGEAIRVG